MSKIYERYDMSGEFECYFTLIDARIMSFESLLQKALKGEPYKINVKLSNYQGACAWDKSKVQTLLDDLCELVKRTKPYVLGTMVFSKVKGGYSVADGRQRLITLMLILRALDDKDKAFLGEFKGVRKLHIKENTKFIELWCKEKLRNKKERLEFSTHLKEKIEFIIATTNGFDDVSIFLDSAKGKGFKSDTNTLNLNTQIPQQQRRTKDKNEIRPCCIGSLILNRFEIPAYHRLYSWQSPHIKAFLKDIKSAFDKNKELCIGAIITAYQIDKNGSGVNIMLDGEQRLTTLWLMGFYIASKKECGRWAKKWGRLIFYAHSGELRIITPAQAEFMAVMSEFARRGDFNFAVFKDEKLDKVKNALKCIQSWFEECKSKGVNLSELAAFIYDNVVFKLAQLALDEKEARHFFARIQHF